MLSRSICLPGRDSMFGPQVDPTCRAFDFTLYFEDLVLVCVPAGAFLLLLPAAVWSLFHKVPVVTPSKLLYAKLVVLLGIVIFQTAFLGLRVQITPLHNDASIAADILFLAAFAGAIMLSYLDHIRSIRPSTVLAIFLSTMTLLSVARVRTIWLVWSTNSIPMVIPVLLSFILILTLVSLLLESLEKRKNIDQTDPDATPEQFSGFWKRTSFAWLASTFRQGYRRILTVHELPALDPKLDTDVLLQQLESKWSKYDKKKKHSLLKACFHAFSVSLLTAVIPRLCLTGFTFAQPFLINTTINYVGGGNSDSSIGHGLIGAYALVYVGKAISTALYWYQTFRFLTRLRGSLIALIYQQTMQVRAVDLGDITALTLMGTDTERIVDSFRSIHELWGSLLDIGIAVWLLERQVSAACVMPALIAAIFIGATFKISALASNSQRLWIERVEERLKITSSMLGDMKAVKMLGLTDKMESIIQGLRQVEIETSKVFRKILIWQIFLSNSPATFAPAATFAVFVIIAVVQHDHSLLTAQAFTTLSLISLLTSPVLAFIQAVPSVIQCIGCFNRIQEYCSAPQTSLLTAPEVAPLSTSVLTMGKLARIPDESLEGVAINLQTMSQEVSDIDFTLSQHLVSFRNCSFGWTKTEGPILKNITVDIEMKSITVVVGSIRSGKSTFLESILGETLELQGHALRSGASIAYCSQTAWLTNQSVRSNIVGAADIDENWYASVLWSCGLESDFTQMAEGDRTNVGSNGVNLSGGQKQRIALARALYARRKVILMDDIFSGMDSRTVEMISRRLFSPQGFFRRHFTTVVLATHTHKLLPFADNIIVLEDGRILESGSLQSLQASDGYIEKLSLTILDDAENADTYHPLSAQADESAQVETPGSFDEVLHDPCRQNGDFSVYRYYTDVSGHRPIILFLLFMLLWSFCGEFPTVWLKLWSDANDQSPNHNGLGMYIGVYTFLGVAGMLFMTAACWFLFITIITNSALQLHKDLLQSTLRAPFRFFNKTDVGSLTNRFSQDMELIDMNLPLLAINYVSAACSCLLKIIILAIFAEYLGITIPFVAAVIFFLQKYYLRTSRQVRLLDIEAKAPLYSHFLESVTGAGTIRAFGWQARFEATCHALLDLSQRPVYLLYCIQQWLGFVLDLIVAALAVILVSIIVTWKDKFSPGAVGVSLVMVMTFNATLMSLIKYWTLLETSIGAVARVKAFVATTESEERTEATDPLPQDWPENGAVSFSRVFASHSAPKNPVLKGLTLSIKPGEKVAVCGRSGSGKTSLILSILQMLRIDQGSVTIDGLDVTKLSYVDLRSRINVVPQDPFLMPGTLRFNIDPFQTVTDEEIIRALEKVGLWNAIQTDGGLDKSMEMASWSVGQRQLLCLARAIVRKSKILILDEATSSVDNITEAIMQNIIDTEFANSTVLAVVHRLSFVTHYDKVALLDAGTLAEFDSPRVLLSRESAFSALYKASGH